MQNATQPHPHPLHPWHVHPNRIRHAVRHLMLQIYVLTICMYRHTAVIAVTATALLLQQLPGVTLRRYTLLAAACAGASMAHDARHMRGKGISHECVISPTRRTSLTSQEMLRKKTPHGRLLADWRLLYGLQCVAFVSSSLKACCKCRP